MAAVIAVRIVPATAMLRTIPMAVSVSVVVSMSVVSVLVRGVAVTVSIDWHTGRRSHDHGRGTMARRHHDRCGITNYHSRKWRQRNANVNVDSCLGSCSSSKKNRCEHC